MVAGETEESPSLPGHCHSEESRLNRDDEESPGLMVSFFEACKCSPQSVIPTYAGIQKGKPRGYQSLPPPRFLLSQE